MHATLKRGVAAFGLALASYAAMPSAAQAANEQFFPLATYRVGAYASSGIPVASAPI